MDEETAERRAELLNEIQSDIMDEYNRSRIGRTEKVLCEGFDPEIGLYYGRSYAESPDVDGRILFTSEEETEESFVYVQITGELEGEPFGTRV